MSSSVKTFSLTRLMRVLVHGQVSSSLSSSPPSSHEKTELHACAVSLLDDTLCGISTAWSTIWRQSPFCYLQMRLRAGDLLDEDE